jgi:hypothetical protein
MMYDPPKLIEVGRAEEVILGIADLGNDLDGLHIIPEMEWPVED